MIENLIEKIDNQKTELLTDIGSVSSPADALNLKNKYLKKYVKSLYQELKNITSPEEKKSAGKYINDFKTFAEEKISEVEAKFKSQKSSSKYDVSIFNGNIKLGEAHPLIKLYKKIRSIKTLFFLLCSKKNTFFLLVFIIFENCFLSIFANYLATSCEICNFQYKLVNCVWSHTFHCTIHTYSNFCSLT